MYLSGAEGDEETSLIYDLSFAYPQAIKLADLLRTAFPPIEATDIANATVACDLQLTFTWGDSKPLPHNPVRLNIHIRVRLAKHTILSLNISPSSRDNTYSVSLVKEGTASELKSLAFEQLKIYNPVHFLPEIFFVKQPSKADRLWDISPQLAQFFNQLFQRIKADLTQNIYYLSSFRKPPQLTYPNVRGSRFLDPYGSDFPQVFWQYKEAKVLFKYVGFPYPDLNRPDEMHLEGAVSWILREVLGLEQPVSVQPVTADMLKVQVETLGPKPQPLTLADVGLGYNQLLPIIIQGLLTPPGGLVIFEQPEIHLHPHAQAKLVPFFVGLAKAGRQVLVETHSSHIIDSLCLEIAKDREYGLEERTSILFIRAAEIEYRSARIETVQLNRLGEILNWPPYFLPDTLVIQGELLRESIKKEKYDAQQQEQR